MTKQEVAVILALFQGNWGHVTYTDQQVAVWVDHLRDVPPASGLTVANQLIKDSERFPTVHEFRTAWRAHLRREQAVGPKAIPSKPTTKDVGLAGIALARVALNDARPIQAKSKEPPKERERRDTA